MSVLMRGSIYYFSYWGAIGLYQGFQAIHFRELGISATQIGFILTLFPLFTIGLSPLLAAWADARHKRVAVLTASLAAMSGSLFSLTFANSFWDVLLGMAALGLSQSAVAPMADSLIGRMASRNGLEFGRMRLWGSFSFAAASALGGLLWIRFGYEAMYPVAGLLFLPLWWVARTLPEIEVQAPKRSSLFQTLAELFKHDRGSLALLGVVLLMGFALGMAAPFLGLAIQDRGGSAVMAGLLFGTIAFCELPMMGLERRIAHKIGDTRALMLACGLYIVAYSGMALASRATVMLMFGVLIGMAFGLFFVGTVRVIDARAKAHQVSTLQSLRNGLAFGLAPLVAGPIGGSLYQSHGPRWVFGLAVLFFSLALGMLWAARRLINTPPRHLTKQGPVN